MAFKNVRMTDEEMDWEATLGMKNPSMAYRYNLGRRPNGSDMTVDRERKMYLFGIMADNEREAPTENTLHYFFFMWEGGQLYPVGGARRIWRGWSRLGI